MKIIEGTSGRFPIALVVSRFNSEVTDQLLKGAIERLKELDFQDSDILIVKVPGAIEIPVVAQRLAQQGVYSAIVALGAVIRGDTSHFDYVCEQVSDGCRHIALQYDLPVIFGVLTTDTDEQALARVTPTNHKGREAIDAAVETVSVLKTLG